MEMEVIKDLTEQGKVLGYEGEELRAFVKEQQDKLRDERRWYREIEREKELRELEREKELRELEREKELREHEKELRMLEIRQLEAQNKDDKSCIKNVRTPKLPHFDDKHDEMDSYLSRFERYALANNWPREIWATNLSALLKGKALDVFARMPVDKALDYDALKSALLKRFNLTEDGFRQKFRSSVAEEGETFQQFASRLSSYLDRWIELAEIGNTFAGLYDLIVCEQITNMCGEDLVLFIKEHVPKSVKDLTKIADQFREARGFDITKLMKESGGKVKHVGYKSQTNTQLGLSRVSSKPGHGDNKVMASENPSKGKSERRCYRCGRIGHIASQCRSNPGSNNQGKSVKTETCNAFLSTSNVLSYSHGSSDVVTSGACESRMSCGEMPTVDGICNGVPVKVLRDTGCSGVVVKRSLVDDKCLTGTFQRCVLANGSEVEVPIAKVEVSSPYFSGKTMCWCMEKPVYDVLIGNIPGVKDPSMVDEEVVQVVQTRAQVRQAVERKRYKGLKVPTEIEDIGPDEVIAAQKDDDTLAKIRTMVADGISSDKVRYFEQKGMLYREFKSLTVENGRKFVQLVVPKKMREKVMKLAHESLLGGHLACKRTAHKVLAEFYWPGVQADVKRYCQSCDACQRTIPKGKVKRAPLGKMPIIDIPFQRVAVDIVGPIEPRSAKGNRYILTLMDYATRYPEAVALPSIEAERVAESLLEMFCRLGVPREILTDLGAQFTSGVMKEVSRLLSIKQLTTTPFHPACNGLVEKFNGSLKLMLKRLCLDRPKDWDRYIGPVLFSFRDAPQESLGFTPFELIYGRSVRGPMSILRELWTKQIDDSDVKTTYQYVVDLQDRLETSYDIAHVNLEKASKRYARIYNRRAKPKQIKVGQRVLVLLPTKPNKLLLQWKGPFKVIEKVGTLDYRIEMGDKIKMFHANMLKPYHERDESVGYIEPVLSVVNAVVVDVEAEGSVSEIEADALVDSPSIHDVDKDYQIGKILSTGEAKQLAELVDEFSDVLSSKPGITNLGKHDIKLTTDTPIRSKPYPVPFALKQVVIKEVESMLELDVIEPSDSQYCSNYVIVKKADGTNRFCIDFRPLNKVTVFDCEPLPTMDDIFVKLADCKYLTKIDLTKGYWQLPLTENAKPLTAFQTPKGLYQFKTMPFGLVCASASFSRIMRKLLCGMENADNFIDDIMVFTRTFEHHLEVLRELFGRLRLAKLTAKPSKCYFCFEQIECLGHVVGGNRLKPNPEKLKAIADAPRPETKKQVRSFLGMIGFYRRFVPDFASIASPLTDLTKKGMANKVKWTESQEVSFSTLKKALCSFPILKVPNVFKPFILQTDASEYGLGAVLLQEEEGLRCPVAYASRKLKSAERSYSTIEKECLACVWGVLKFQRYLYGAEFILETDHQPLSHLTRGKVSNPRLMRWALLLQPYRIRIVAIPGKNNVVADYLSRV